MSLSSRSLQRSQSLQQQAYQALRTAILSGELLPGQRLIETQLAKELQVSRTPIREAIRLLQHEDLVAADANGTLRVATISPADAAQLYDCRIALEELSVREACQNVTDSQLQELEQIVLQAEKTLSNPSPLTNYRLLDLDYRFHRLLAQSAGNPWLVSLLDQVFDKMQLLRIQTLKNNPDVLEIRVEHRRVYELVADKNANAAVLALKEHLGASKKRVLKEVQQLLQNPADAAQ